MPTIREQFHTIANILNKIVIITSCTAELLKDKPIATLTPEELKLQQEKLIQDFAKLEEATLDADKKITELKTVIYKKIDPETDLQS